MGATNVLAAFAQYAGKVPPLSMVLLTYMAAVSKDTDAEPWFGMGHKALAEHALGRTPPIEEADTRAVERAIGPLLKVGAIVADRRAAPRGEGAKTVRYRLNLRSDVPRFPWGEVDVPRKPVDERPTESVRDVPRFPAERPTVCDETSHGNRGTEEYEETGGETEERNISLSARAPRPDAPADEKRETRDRPRIKPTPIGLVRSAGILGEHEIEPFVAWVTAEFQVKALRWWEQVIANDDLPELVMKWYGSQAPPPRPRPCDRPLSEALAAPDGGPRFRDEETTLRGAAAAREALRSRQGGYQPWRDPPDPSVYYEEM